VPIHDVTEEFGVEMFLGGVGEFMVVPRLVASRLVAQVDAHISVSLALRAGEIPWSVYYTRRELARERAQAFSRFREAIRVAMRWLTTSSLPQIVEELGLKSLPELHPTVETIARYQGEDVWSSADVLDEPLERWQGAVRAAGLLDRPFSREEAVYISGE
jgi:NitT/TauT family transport system substrate-binding protein